MTMPPVTDRLRLTWFGLAVLLLAACRATPPPPTPTPTATPLPTATPFPTPTATPAPAPIELAWFYKPPLSKADLASLPERFDFFILTHGDEAERDQMRALGATGLMLQYVRFDAIHDPGKCDANPYRNQAAYHMGDFCRISAEHPDWFLLDRAGQRIVNPDGEQKYVLMDPGHPGWRAFWLERIRHIQADPQWDGVFLDNVETTFEFRESQNEMPAAYAAEAEYRAAIAGFLQQMRDYLQPRGRLLYANLIARRDDLEPPPYLDLLDGVMIESWATSRARGFREPARWERQMQLAEQVQAQGKVIVLVPQGAQHREELQRFALASYLLVQSGRAVFRYANSDNYREIWLYPNYDVDLGLALGPRQLEADGSWRRDFERGYVLVHPINQSATIAVTSGSAP